MKITKRFKKDILFDAQMVMAVRKNMLEPFAIHAGLKPSEIFARKIWLPKQSRQYLHAVETEISHLQTNDIKDSIN